MKVPRALVARDALPLDHPTSLIVDSDPLYHMVPHWALAVRSQVAVWLHVVTDPLAKLRATPHRQPLSTATRRPRRAGRR